MLLSVLLHQATSRMRLKALKLRARTSSLSNTATYLGLNNPMISVRILSLGVQLVLVPCHGCRSSILNGIQDSERDSERGPERGSDRLSYSTHW